ncbi:MAG: hypothetical protein ACP5RC_12385, partial [Halothiobacillaceae bacterium]
PGQNWIGTVGQNSIGADIAAALNALDGPTFNPFKLTETTFADDLRFRLEGPTNFSEENIYAALRAFARG